MFWKLCSESETAELYLKKWRIFSNEDFWKLELFNWKARIRETKIEMWSEKTKHSKYRIDHKNCDKKYEIVISRVSK